MKINSCLKNIIFIIILLLTNKIKPMECEITKHVLQNNKPIRCPEFPNNKFTRENEDRDIINREWDKDIIYLGIYDGHGTSDTAEYLRNNLHSNILKIYQQTNNLIRAINQGFSQTNKEILQDETIKNSGSCAIVAFILKDKIIIANCGDSRAVLGKNNQIIQLSNDHKINNVNEQQRIIQNNGLLNIVPATTINPYTMNSHSDTTYKNQNWNTLAIARTFGDAMFVEPPMPAGCIIAEPEITTYDLQGDEEFLILASDGLWDKIKNQKIYNIINLNQSKNTSEILATKARQKGSADDITVITLYFKRQ
ncbi:hypothetical protein GF322_03995 [Candidatus Dependentiae bacterium]|nr:hypothetical protein [Candidatus Dependentiae bacterium]